MKDEPNGHARIDFLEGVLASIPSLVSYLDRDLVYRYVNAGYERWFGTTKEFCVGRNMVEVVGQAAVDAVRPNLEAALRGEAQDFERFVNYRTGGSRHIRLKYIPDRDQAGVVQGITAIISDITGIKEREDKYRLVVEAMHDGFVVQNARAEIIQFNPAALEILGLSEDQLLGRTSLDPKWKAIRSDRQPFPGHEHPAIIALKTGNKVSGVLMGIELPTGVSRWIRITASPYVGQSIAGEVLDGVPSNRWVMCSFADVTDFIATKTQLTDFFDASLDLIVIANTDGSLKMVNPTFKKTLGYSDEEILSRGFMHFIHPDDVAATQEVVAKLAHGERLVKFENRYRTASGAYRQLSWNCYPNIETGDLYATGRDVTDLRDSEEGFRQLMTALNEVAIVGVTDAAGVIIEVNDNFCKISGYAREELLGKDHRIINSKAHPKDFFADLWKTISSGWTWSGDIQNRNKSGALYWVRSVIAPLYNADKKIVKYMAIRFDVTPQKMAEQENMRLHDEIGKALVQSRISEASFREVFDHVPVGIIKIDNNFRFLSVNPAYAKMLGYTIDEIMGMTMPELTHPEDRVVSTTVATRLMDGGRDFRQFEKRYLHKSGKVVWARISSHLLEADEHQMPRTLSVVEDITAAREIEKQLIAARDEAIASGLAKSQFLANMSHEIRTPLNGILGNLELLQAERLSADQRKFSDDALESGRVLMGLLNDILNFSKINAGQLVLDPSPFALQDVVYGVEQIYGSIFKEKGLALELIVAPDVPQCVVGDSLRVRQILNNLASNAVKFTKEGKVTVSATRGNGDEIVFAVSDTGIGISRVNAAKLFTPFTQADSGTTRKFGGTGLGLSISRELARLMGGDITLASEEEVGTTFSVSINLPECAASCVLPSSQVSTPGGHVPPMRILVAEDNHINQSLTRRILEKAGHTVTIAENGEDALKALECAAFDVILMDCQMPIMDGFEATARIIKEYRDKRPKIVALTANAFKEDEEQCYAAGMDYYLSKPVSRKQLDAILFKIVGDQHKAG